MFLVFLTEGNKEKEHLKTAERNPINPLHSVQRENNTKDVSKEKVCQKSDLIKEIRGKSKTKKKM